ncbi:MAG: hypothetical protein ACYS0G_15720 [Planctomycetota bacterium]|jgi:hypothetical protein
MRYTAINPPRAFDVGRSAQIEMKDCARIELEPSEQVTFLTDSGAEYDVARREFGYYATPSLNGRLSRFGLRAVLIKNGLNRFFVLLVEDGKEDAFEQYLADEQLQVVWWMDSDRALAELERKVCGD